MNAVEIRPGQTLQGEIAIAHEQKLYTFSARAGQTVQARVTGIGETPFSAFPELRGPDAQMLDNALSFETAELEATLPLTGTYTIVAKEFDNGTGPFTVSMVLMGEAVDAADADIGVIRNGETLRGEVSLPGDLDLATFYAREGDVVQVRMTGTGPEVFDAMPELFGPNGQELDRALSFATAEFTARIAQTGMQSVICKAAGARTGPYSLSMIRMPGYTQAGADSDLRILVRGQTHAGTVSEPGDLDAGVFAAVQGDHVLIRMRRATASAFSSEIELYSPSGERIGPNFSFDWAEISADLPESGVYTVIAKEFSTTVGPYTLTWDLTGGNTAPDVDGDGMSNEEELQLGTNPFDANSALRLTAQSGGTGLVILRWQTQGGRRYRIRYSDNLAVRGLTDLPRPESEERESDAPAGEADWMEATVNAEGGARFFRVIVID